MKLSEAIRLGATLTPQIQGTFKSLDGTCAVGSALDACGKASYNYLECWVAALELFPILSQPVTARPSVVPTWVDRVVFITIMYLNDACNWTREQIADWVETIESQHPEFNSSPASPISIPEPVNA